MESYSNRLINEKSPYLLQHAHNPVNWYPWGDEAFETAERENKLIFLSIGYSTCHWCHVMERESFTDRQVADAMGLDPDEGVSASHLALVDAMRSFDPGRGSERTWIARRVRWTVADELQKLLPLSRWQVEKGAVPPVLVPLEAGSEPQEGDFADEATVRVSVATALAALPDREQRILEAIYVHDAKMADVAGILGLSVREVQRIHARALEELRSLLGSGQNHHDE